MFCNKCGAQIPDNSKFCPKCGAQIIPTASESAKVEKAADPISGSAPQNGGKGTPKTPPEKKKRKIWIPVVIIIAVVAVVLIVLAATGVFSRKTVKLNNYLSVEFNGYDGYGTARVGLDTYKLEEDYDGKIKVSDEAEYWGYYYFSDVVDDTVYVHASPSGSLSNGEEVTIDWDVSQDYFDEMIKGNVKLTYEPETYTVSDLEPVETFDAFAGITVDFAGVSPNAYAGIAYHDGTAGVPDGVWNYLDLSLSKSEDLSVGDTVTVTISEESANNLMKNMGLHPEEMSKDYVVEGIPYYVTSLDQIPEEGMDKMKEQAEDVRKAITANGSLVSEGIGTLTHEYIGSWFLCEKSGLNNDDVNLIYMVYKMHVSAVGENDDGSEKKIEQDYYWYCGFRNGMVLDDGTFSIDYSDYFEPSGTYSWWSGISGEAFFIDGIDPLFAGYENLDSMFNSLVTSKIADYTYESTVQE